ncbi:MAG: hypothetical protein CL830_01895 [Crocinitomicaceae bacterium]|nr:hypothetical protein [Crocinitomicaceae bacterium]
MLKKVLKTSFFAVLLNFQTLKINFHLLVIISISTCFSLTLVIVIHVMMFKLKGYVWYGCLSYPFFFIVFSPNNIFNYKSYGI